MSGGPVVVAPVVIAMVWFQPEADSPGAESFAAAGHGRRYLDELVAGVRRWAGEPVEFVCLTDRPDALPDGVAAVPLVSGFRSKLQKLELFRPDFLPGRRVVYSDLDNLIVGPIGALLGYRGPLGVRRNFPSNIDISRCQTSWIAFEGGTLGRLWDEARALPDLAERYPIGGGRGDQRFVSDRLEASPGDGGLPWDDLEVVFPGQLVSFKWRTRRGVGEGARVAYCHGRPKPHEFGWAWKG